MKRGVKTLADVIIKSVEELSFKPEDRVKKKPKIRKKAKKNIRSAERSFFVSSIIRSILNTTIENSKEKNKSKQKEDFDKEYKIIDDERDAIVDGGYGTVSRHYGTPPKANYVDYNKLFSYLGSFKSKSMYEDFDSNSAITPQKGIETTREMVSTETMDKASKHFKYFLLGEVLGDVGFVPPVGVGIDSKEWEKYRLMSMMSIYRPLIALKRSSA